MTWDTTKRLVDEHFVPAVGPSTDPAFGALVPEDDPLEECRLVIFQGEKLFRSEAVYANPSVGRDRIRATIRLVIADRATPGG